MNTDVMIIYYGEFYHTHLTDYRSFWVCQQPNLSEIPVWPISLSALAGISTLISIVICIVFMYKTYKLITKTPKMLMMQRSIRRKAQALVEVNIKHTLLMSSSVLWFVVIVNIDSKLLNVLPLGFLGVGMAAYMVFEFGETKYHLIFGRLHLFLLNKWLSRYPYLPTIPKSSPKSESQKSRKSSRSSRKSSRSSRKSGSTTFEPSLASVPEDNATLFTDTDDATLFFPESPALTLHSKIEMLIECL